MEGRGEEGRGEGRGEERGGEVRVKRGERGDQSTHSLSYAWPRAPCANFAKKKKSSTPSTS
jgi:hypothetical protein